MNLINNWCQNIIIRGNELFEEVIVGGKDCRENDYRRLYPGEKQSNRQFETTTFFDIYIYGLKQSPWDNNEIRNLTRKAKTAPIKYRLLSVVLRT